jgi:uncharacterized membrane protein (DUF4010 family)
MEAVAGVFAWIYLRRNATSQSEATTEVSIKNPFSLTAAAKFAAVFAAVLLAVKVAQQNLPANSVYAVSALAGLTDVDAITLSMAESARTGGSAVAVNAIVIAALTNTVVKCGMVMALGAPALRRPVGVATAAILAIGVGVVILL